MALQLGITILSIFLIINHVALGNLDLDIAEFADDFNVLRGRLNGLPETLIEKRIAVIFTILTSSYERANAIIPVAKDVMEATSMDLKDHVGSFRDHINFYDAALKQFMLANDKDIKGIRKVTSALQKMDPIERTLFTFGTEPKEDATTEDKEVAAFLERNGLEKLRKLWMESNERLCDSVISATQQFLDSLTKEEKPFNTKIVKLFEEVQAEVQMNKKMHSILKIANLMAEK